LSLGEGGINRRTILTCGKKKKREGLNIKNSLRVKDAEEGGKGVQIKETLNFFDT